MEKENKIQFKALHEGMGFHPFSDGLPYAPNRQYSTGAGAVSAGRPQFMKPSNPPAHPALPTVTARHTMLRAPLIMEQAKVKTQAKAESKTAPIIPNMTSDVTDPGVITRSRIYAYTLDSFIHAGFWMMTNLTALFFLDFQFDLTLVEENWMHFTAFLVISQWLFIALQELLFETTLGKMFFGLEFKRNHRSLLLRSMLFMIAAASVVGLFMKWQDVLGKVSLKSENQNS